MKTNKINIKFGNNWAKRKIKVKKILRGIQSGKCNWCKKELFGDETVDHIIPFSRGGKSKINNYQLLHRKCHREKDKKYFKLNL